MSSPCRFSCTQSLPPSTRLLPHSLPCSNIDNKGSYDEITKAVERVDEAIQEDVLVMKVDVEGFEPGVLRSTRDTLLKVGDGGAAMEDGPVGLWGCGWQLVGVGVGRAAPRRAAAALPPCSLSHPPPLPPPPLPEHHAPTHPHPPHSPRAAHGGKHLHGVLARRRRAQLQLAARGQQPADVDGHAPRGLHHPAPRRHDALPAARLCRAAAAARDGGGTLAVWHAVLQCAVGCAMPCCPQTPSGACNGSPIACLSPS